MTEEQEKLVQRDREKREKYLAWYHSPQQEKRRREYYQEHREEILANARDKRNGVPPSPMQARLNEYKKLCKALRAENKYLRSQISEMTKNTKGD